MQVENCASLFIQKQVSVLKHKNIQYFVILSQAGFTIQANSDL